MRSRGVAKMMFLNVRCVLQDRIGLNDISPYFLYLLLCISWFWSGKCSETGEVTISLCGMKNSNQNQLYITYLGFMQFLIR